MLGNSIQTIIFRWWWQLDNKLTHNRNILRIKKVVYHMKMMLVSIALTTVIASAFGQTQYGFGAGQIITKKGDTINCFVEVAVTYWYNVAYKTSESGTQYLLPSKEVKSIVTPYAYWENIIVGKNEWLMALMIDGKARLFNHLIMNEGPKQSSNGGTSQMYQAPTITYVIAKDSMYHEVKKKNFKLLLGQLFNNCPSVIQKLNDKTYKFEDLEKIVLEYNVCE